ncbi:HEAT repeat domain-containing protein [Pseudomarimonas salicorniae]|uniref:HEAT repeat n=1 Tax=Pseudomarimonas salicorniae TaxID=2933270 RepID=A0ABT0GG84_9GAMM|nr:HEAT repeat domain-containing protein [Lysobacter sp. CAU 1642]MCK7593025.1 hypothetical protein [Lysobacter sp. CAU 1642]
MNRTFAVLILAALIGAAAQAMAPAPRQTHALVVVPMPEDEQAGQRLASLLRNGYAVDSVELLAGDTASSRRIRSQLDALGRRLGPRDGLILIVLGRSTHSGAGPVILTPDYDDADLTLQLSLARFEQVVSALPVGASLRILPACRSRTDLTPMPADPMSLGRRRVALHYCAGDPQRGIDAVIAAIDAGTEGKAVEPPTLAELIRRQGEGRVTVSIEPEFLDGNPDLALEPLPTSQRALATLRDGSLSLRERAAPILSLGRQGAADAAARLEVLSLAARDASLPAVLRDSAIRKIGELGERAGLDVLWDLIEREGAESLRVAALKAAARIEHALPAERLERVLASAPPRLSAAIRELLPAGNDAGRTLSDPSEPLPVRLAAWNALKKEFASAADPSLDHPVAQQALRLTRDPSAALRAEAALWLAPWSDRAPVQPLLVRLAQSDATAEVRQVALYSLGKAFDGDAPPREVDAVFREQAANGPSPDVRAAALWALGRTGPRAAPLIEPYASNPSEPLAVRDAALLALEGLPAGNSAAIVPLTRPDTPDLLRVAALRVLGRWNEAIAVGPVLDAAAESNPSLSAEALSVAAALSRYDPAIERIATAPKTALPIRQAALGIAARSEDPRGEALLREALASPNAALRRSALDTITEIRVPGLECDLIRAANGQRSALKIGPSTAVAILRGYESPGAQRALLRAAKGDDPSLRVLAIQGLDTKDEGTRDELIRLTRDPDAQVTAASAQQLQQSIQDPRVNARLREIARDDKTDQALRESVAESVRQYEVERGD